MNINILIILLILLLIIIFLECTILYNIHLLYKIKIDIHNERNRFNFTNNINKNNDKNIIKSKNYRDNRLLNSLNSFFINFDQNKLYIIDNKYKCIHYNLQYNISYNDDNNIIIIIKNIPFIEYEFYINDKSYLDCENITLFDLNNIYFI